MRRLIILVGGSGDIGHAVSRKLGELGYRVMVTGRTEPRLTEAVRGLQLAGLDVRGVVCDLNDDNSIANVFDWIRNTNT